MYSFSSHLYADNSQQCVPGLAHPLCSILRNPSLTWWLHWCPPALQTQHAASGLPLPQWYPAASPAQSHPFPPSLRPSYTDLHVPCSQNTPSSLLVHSSDLSKGPFPDYVRPPRVTLSCLPALLPYCIIAGDFMITICFSAPPTSYLLSSKRQRLSDFYL